MSGLDLVARGLAGKALAAQGDVTFAEIASHELAQTAAGLSTTGHAVRGRGAGHYVADDLASELLLAAHPRFCARTRNGRIVRLMAGHGAISVEQGGALGDPGGTRLIDDREAVQATFDYAAAVGIRHVVFEQREYTIWNTHRTSPTTDRTARDGHPLVLSETVSVASAAGDTYLHFRGPAGELLEDIVFYAPRNAGDPHDQVWRGGGILVLGGSAAHAGAADGIAKLTIDHIHLIGGRGRSDAEGIQVQTANPQPVDGWDHSDKGIIFDQVTVGEVELSHVEVAGFKGELVYFGGGHGPKLTMTHCHFHDTNGDALNPGMVHPESSFSHCRIGNAYQGIESLGGSGQTWSQCLIYDTAKNWLIAGPTPFFLSGYSYDYTTRDEAIAAPWIIFEDVHFRNAGVTQIGSWARGSVRTTDTTIKLASAGGLRDVDLVISAMVDQKTGLSSCALHGPQNLTTQVPGCPAGTFELPPENVRVHVRHCGRTMTAARNDRKFNSVFTLSGLYGRDVILSAGDATATRYLDIVGTPLQLPQLRLPESFTLVGAGQPLGGGYVNIPTGGSVVLDPLNLSYAVYPGGVGVHDVGLAAPASMKFADSQRIRMVHGGGLDRRLRFRRYNGGLAMETEVVLFEVGDWIEFAWDAALNRWRYVAHSGAGERYKYGSKTYDIPAIDPGQSHSFTITVRNAYLGDAVNLATTGDLLGLVANGRVTSTHNVTVSLYNLSAAQIDPGGMTFIASVLRTI